MLGVPLSSEVDLTSGLTLVLDLEPLVESTVDGEGGKLCLSGTDDVVSADLIIPNVEFKVVSEVVNLAVPVGPFPLGFLTTVLADGGLPLLLAGLHLDVGVHLAKSLGLVGDVSLEEVDS